MKKKSELRLARMSKGLTMTEAAKLIGVSKSLLSLIESGYASPRNISANSEFQRIYKGE